MFKLFFFLCVYTASYNGMETDVPVKEFNGYRYLSLKPISQLLDSKINYLQKSGRIFWQKGNQNIVLTDKSPWITIDGKPYNFPLPVIKQDDEVFIPPSMLIPLLKSRFNLLADLRDDEIVLIDRKIKIEKIVIDAGHGGKDPGAIGLNKTKEKDVVLKISLIVADELSKLGTNCILTRDTDVFIPLQERTDIANKKGADIFISIHMNAYKNRNVRGCEVYFLSKARTDWERAVEAKENSVIEFEDREITPDLESIMWDLSQAEHLTESKELAAFILESIVKRAKVPSKGVKQANFHVLRGAYMPAVLVEGEYLSYPECEKKLKDSNFVRNIALGIVDGVKEFIEVYEKQMNYD